MHPPEILISEGPAGLKSRKSPGRKPKLTESQKKELSRIIIRGPLKAGFPGACRRSPMIQHLIYEKFGVFYAVNCIPELLKNTGFSFQKARFVPSRADRSARRKRRVMIARALVHSPKILFLDEPSVGLDAGIRRRIWALIRKIQQNGTTIFLTTHYIEEAEFLAKRVAFLDEGNIVATDTPQNLMDRLGTWAIDRVGESDMTTSCFKTKEDARKYMTQREESFTLRRVNLEDAFFSLTGKKVK